MPHLYNIKIVYIGCFCVFITGCLNNNPKIDQTLNLKDSLHLSYIVDAYYGQSDPDSMIFYADILIRDASKTKSRLFIAKGFYYKANGIRLKSNIPKAMECLLKCLEYANQINNPFLTSAAYVQMGSFYSELNNHNAAISYYKLGTTQLKQLQNNQALIMAYYNLGGEYTTTGILDSALFFYQLSDSLSIQINDSINSAFARGNIGIVLAKSNKKEAAYGYLTQACKTLSKDQKNKTYISYYLWLSILDQQQKRIDKALANALTALRLSKMYDLKRHIPDAYEQLAEIYGELNDYPKANAALKQYYAYRDSIVNTETITKMANLRTEFEVGQKQAELDAMAENERFKTLIAWILLVALSSVAILLVIVYRHNRHNKRLLAQLKIQKAELELANETKDRFFSVISHDLRGPMGAIGNLVILANDALVSEQMAELRSLLNMMGDNSREVETLLNNLLHWSVGQRGAYQKHFDTINFNQLVNNVISIYTPIAIAKGIELTFSPSQPSHWVVTDPNSWAVIVRNLVNNAIKFTHTGGKVEITTSQKENILILKISDTGIGMEKSVVENLFKSSVNLPQWGTNYEKGMGIGLSLIKDFVDINDGEIEVSSVLGKGTTFTVMIPVGQAKEDHLQLNRQLCLENTED
jgi:two-component system NtrC family sensor kinase